MASKKRRTSGLVFEAAFEGNAFLVNYASEEDPFASQKQGGEMWQTDIRISLGKNQAYY